MCLDTAAGASVHILGSSLQPGPSAWQHRSGCCDPSATWALACLDTSALLPACTLTSTCSSTASPPWRRVMVSLSPDILQSADYSLYLLAASLSAMPVSLCLSCDCRRAAGACTLLPPQAESCSIRPQAALCSPLLSEAQVSRRSCPGECALLMPVDTAEGGPDDMVLKHCAGLQRSQVMSNNKIRQELRRSVNTV